MQTLCVQTAAAPAEAGAEAGAEAWEAALASAASPPAPSTLLARYPAQLNPNPNPDPDPDPDPSPDPDPDPQPKPKPKPKPKQARYSAPLVLRATYPAMARHLGPEPSNSQLRQALARFTHAQRLDEARVAEDPPLP